MKITIQVSHAPRGPLVAPLDTCVIEIEDDDDQTAEDRADLLVYAAAAARALRSTMMGEATTNG